MREQEKKSFPPISDQNQKGGYLLVADSDINSLFYTSILLERLNFHPHIAKTGHEAFLAATSAVPALIITALDLADVSGLTLMQLLRKNLKTAGVPFIVLRRPEEIIKEQQCFNAGAVDCLTKPVSAEVLYQAVQAAMSCHGKK